MKDPVSCETGSFIFMSNLVADFGLGIVDKWLEIGDNRRDMGIT